MVTAVGREPEPVFGDALAGTGGMGEPVQPNLFDVASTDEVFPDALSGVLTAGVGDPPLPFAALPVVPAAPPPLVRPQQPAPRRNTQPQPRARPLTQNPPLGPPVGAPRATAPSSNPTVSYVPVPGAPPANVSLVRPPAYLPQSAGIAHIRAALQQARQSTANRSRTTVSSARRKSSGVWGVVVALLIVLVVTGAAEKIITAISQLLQGS